MYSICTDLQFVNHFATKLMKAEIKKNILPIVEEFGMKYHYRRNSFRVVYKISDSYKAEVWFSDCSCINLPVQWSSYKTCYCFISFPACYLTVKYISRFPAQDYLRNQC